MRARSRETAMAGRPKVRRSAMRRDAQPRRRELSRVIETTAFRKVGRKSSTSWGNPKKQCSKHSVLRESLRNARSGTQSVANLALAVDFLPGLRYHLLGQILGNDDDSVHVRENEISGAHRYAAAKDRDVRLHDIHPSEGVVGRQSSAEGGKAELDDFCIVSSAAIGHYASCFPAPRGGRKQPAPGGRQFLRVALGYEQVTFPQVIDDLDFEAVRALRQLPHGGEARGHGLAPGPHRGNERPDVRTHALDAAAETVQRIHDHAGKALCKLLVVLEILHGRFLQARLVAFKGGPLTVRRTFRKRRRGGAPARARRACDSRWWPCEMRAPALRPRPLSGLRPRRRSLRTPDR